MLLNSEKPSGNRRESGVELLLTANTRRALMMEPTFDSILPAIFRSRLRSNTPLQYYASLKIFYTEEIKTFYEQLNAVHKRLTTGEIVVVMGSSNILLGLVMILLVTARTTVKILPISVTLTDLTSAIHCSSPAFTCRLGRFNNCLDEAFGHIQRDARRPG